MSELSSRCTLLLTSPSSSASSVTPRGPSDLRSSSMILKVFSRTFSMVSLPEDWGVPLRKASFFHEAEMEKGQCGYNRRNIFGVSQNRTLFYFYSQQKSLSSFRAHNKTRSMAGFIVSVPGGLSYCEWYWESPYTNSPTGVSTPISRVKARYCAPMTARLTSASRAKRARDTLCAFSTN